MSTELTAVIPWAVEWVVDCQLHYRCWNLVWDLSGLPLWEPVNPLWVIVTVKESVVLLATFETAIQGGALLTQVLFF